MRTVFVNPASVNPTYRGSYKRRGRGRKRRSNPGYSNPTRNPSLKDVSATARHTALIIAGTVGGAALNRLALSTITSNFYLRNGARILAAAVLSSMRVNQTAAIAAAGAVLAPMIPEVETMLASRTAATSNPTALAAELADILEADLQGDDDDDQEVSDILEADDDDEW